MKLKILLITLFAFFAVSHSHGYKCAPQANIAGTPDRCFGIGGMNVTHFPSGNAEARAVAVQPDGKIVVAGNTKIGSTSDFAIVRYLENGLHDVAFGNEGIATLDISGRNDLAYSVAILPDGAILVGGLSDNWFALARFNADGSPDQKFGVGGVVLKDIGVPDPQIGVFSKMKIQDDGRIVMVGGGNLFYSPTWFFPRVVRFNADGSLDNTFDGDGELILSGYDSALDVRLLPGGRMLVAGSGDGRLLMTRFEADGTPDATFGVAGTVSYQDPTYRLAAWELITEHDGSLLVNGIAGENIYSYRYSTLIRFNSAGDYQASVLYPTLAANAVIGLSDGKIFIGGAPSWSGNADFSLLRLNRNFTLDTSFANGGEFQAGFGGYNSTCLEAVFQPDDKVICVGRTESNWPDRIGFAIVRLLMGSQPAAVKVSGRREKEEDIFE